MENSWSGKTALYLKPAQKKILVEEKLVGARFQIKTKKGF